MKFVSVSVRRENCGKARDAGEIAYLVLHGSARGAHAQALAEQLSHTVLGKSTHYFVDERGIWQAVPDEITAFHCGARGAYFHPYCRNRNSIGITLCVRADGDSEAPFYERTLDHAAVLLDGLCRGYGIPRERVLRHYDVTHAVCPAPLVRNRRLWRYVQTLF